MKVSVIIATYNGERKILKLLEALKTQTYQGYELIIVNDGSNDRTKDIIEALYSDFSDLKIINSKNEGRAKARNKGAKLALGDVLVFFDDDTRPLQECLNVHMDHHNKYPKTICTGSIIEDYNVLKKDLQRYKAFQSRKWEATLTKALTNDVVLLSRPYLTAANFSIEKQLFHKMGGFDSRLSDAEDYDFAVRALENNVPLYYNPNAKAWHDDFISCETYIIRRRQYNKAHQILKTLKPEQYKIWSTRLSMQRTYKKKIFALFANRQLMKLIDKDVFKYLLPQKLRYRFYDIVITALSLYYPNKQL